MRRDLAAAVLSCVAVIGFAQQDDAEGTRSLNEIHLRAKVQAVVPLNDFSGKVLPVDFDPRFALTVRIVSVSPPVTDFNPHAVVTFAIHSPAIVFAGDFSKGKTYNFSLCRETDGGKVRLSNLGIRLAHGATIGGCG